MSTVDFKKTLKHLYQPASTHFEVVEVPPMNFLMIDGHGDPNKAPEYRQAVEALYSVAYKLKFICKKELGVNFVVLPLEGLWWTEDMSTFSTDNKDAWDWTMMIMQPEPVSSELYTVALEQAAKKPQPLLDRLRYQPYHEGLAVQILHLGPFEAEAPTLARLHHHFIPDNGYVMTGKHHEIYLSDPRKVAPEKLKTILRQPVRAASSS